MLRVVAVHPIVALYLQLEERAKPGAVSRLHPKVVQETLGHGVDRDHYGYLQPRLSVTRNPMKLALPGSCLGLSTQMKRSRTT